MRLRKLELEGVTVVKLGMNDAIGDDVGYFEIKIRPDTVKFSNIVIAKFIK